MPTTVCITSTTSVGSTFLEWSVNYLAGKTKYFNYHNGIIDLVDTPLTNINAHRHQKNHPGGFKETCEFVNYLDQQTDFSSLYMCPLPTASAGRDLNIDILNISPEHWAQVIEYRAEDFNRTLQWLADKHKKIVYIAADDSLSVYFSTEIRCFDHLLSTNSSFESADDLSKDKDSVFFQASCKQWERLGLVDVWDIRERLALSTRPLEFSDLNVNLSIPHYWLDCKELWFNGEEKIRDIMSWLEIAIDDRKIDHWRHVYSCWSQSFAESLTFQNQYKHIIQAIINGWSFPISLTFDQEVVIQHCLIYQHNLNLKTWQLKKFPNNTLDLHKLLETNTHPLV